MEILNKDKEKGCGKVMNGRRFNKPQDVGKM